MTKDDLAAHVRERLEKEQAEKERARKEKEESHLYTIIKVARDSDLQAQIGHDKFFDLVDHDKVTPVPNRHQCHTSAARFKPGPLPASQSGMQKQWPGLLETLFSCIPDICMVSRQPFWPCTAPMSICFKSESSQ